MAGLLTDPAAPPQHAVGAWRQALLLACGGFLLLQVVWVFAVPPFRGIDEFDHAYRAAAVARGEWVAAPAEATRGTGAWLQVPSDIVSAARPECQRLRYTGPEDCVGTPIDHDTTRIASGAGRYNPLYYAIVGMVALPFDGVAALYAMRAASMALCLALFALAVASFLRTRASQLQALTLAVVATPIVAYSSSIVAPNGPELLAALACWAACLGLVRTKGRPDPLHVTTFAVSGAVLATFRSLGPLWLLLIVAFVAATAERQRLLELVRSRTVWLAAIPVAAAGLFSAWWILSMRSLVIGTADESLGLSPGERLHESLTTVPLWLLQCIAAFPLRDESAPGPVYIAFLVLGLCGVGIGLRAASRRTRRVAVTALLVAIAIPVAATYATVNVHGLAWQGRYGMPFGMGALLLLGQANRTLSWRWLAPGLVLYAMAHTVGPVDVLIDERRDSPLSGSEVWLMPAPAFAAICAVAGASLLWLAAANWRPDVGVEPDEES